MVKAKIEYYRLTISGLPEVTDYNQLLLNIVKKKSVIERVIKRNTKSHSIYKLQTSRNGIFLRFMSYAKGYRPDILNTDNFTIHANPLKPVETNVDWTHTYGFYPDSDMKRYIIMVERNFNGLWASSLEYYLDKIITLHYKDIQEEIITQYRDFNYSQIDVALDPVPGDEFLQRVQALNRIKEVKLRVTRPNPGWGDLESMLADEADDSKAHRYELSMNAKRGKSLEKKTGIVKYILDLFRKKSLGYASFKGETGGKRDEFSTENLGKVSFIDLETDSFGQVNPEDAFEKLSSVAENFDND